MRDINRIDPLLQKLAEAWKKTPDQRFGQFMYNFFRRYGKDPFYAEDDEWMVGIQAYIDGKDIAEAMETYRDSKTDHYTYNLDEILHSAQKALQDRQARFDEFFDFTDEA